MYRIFFIAGGSVAKFVCESLPSLQTDWSKWKLYFVDERLVPIDHPESTLRLYVDGLIGTTPLKRNQIVAVDTSLDGMSQLLITHSYYKV